MHLHPHQKEGAEFLKKHRKALLADEGGNLDKAAQVYMAHDPSLGLIVLTSEYLKTHWKRECDFADLPTTTVLEAYVTTPGDGWRLPDPGQVMITSFGEIPADFASVVLGIDENGRKVEGANLPIETLVKLEQCALVVDGIQHTHNFTTLARTRQISVKCAKTWALAGFIPDLNSMSHLGAENLFYRYGSKLSYPRLLRTREDLFQTRSGKQAIYETLVVDIRDDALRKELDAEPFDQDYSPRLLDRLLADRACAIRNFVEDHEKTGKPLVVFSPSVFNLHRLGWLYLGTDTPIEIQEEILTKFQTGQYKGVMIELGAPRTTTLPPVKTVLFTSLSLDRKANMHAEGTVPLSHSPVRFVRMVSSHRRDSFVQNRLGLNRLVHNNPFSFLAP